MRIIKEHLLPRCWTNGLEHHSSLVRFIEVENGMVFECLENNKYAEIDRKIFEGLQKHANVNYTDYLVPRKTLMYRIGER